MRLSQLEATFISQPMPDGSLWNGNAIANEAQAGICFLCPKCFSANKNSNIGVHSVMCWFLNPLKGLPVDSTVAPKPGRWWRQGTTIETLSLVPSPGRSHSVKLLGGCEAHFFITNGEIVFC